MPAPRLSDPRLGLATDDAWARAALIRERRWLRDVRALGLVATASCSGLVGVRVRLDRATGASSCSCGGPQPCEHALALALECGLEEMAPAPEVPWLDATTRRSDDATLFLGSPSQSSPRRIVATNPERVAEAASAASFTPDHLLLALDPQNPGRLTLAPTQGEVPAEAWGDLRFLWWTRAGGEVRTLAQAVQLLFARGLDVRAPQERASGALAHFRQRALGERVTVRLFDPGSDASLALAKLLADRDARPFPGKLPAEHWTADEVAFAAFFLLAWAQGAQVRANPTLNPRPLEGVDVQLDAGCLPARLKLPEGENAALRAVLVGELGGEPVVDAAHGHVLVPATRVVAVEDALRALGADVCYRRLAPPRERFLEWPEDAPEDRFGARPRLREPWSGTLDAPVPGLREGAALADYQKEAIAFIAHHGHTCLLADDMGLGKTLEAIGAAQLVEGRVLVVCPASARDVWRHEVEKFTTEACEVLLPGNAKPKPQSAQRTQSNNETTSASSESSVVSSRPSQQPKYVVVGYSNLEAHEADIDPAQFALVILDESHYVKNAGAARSRLVRDRLAAIPRRLVISGTPVMNTPDEIRAQLAFLHPDEWSDAQWFRARFEEPFHEGSDEARAAVLKRLRLYLEGVMIRREKKEALPDLPGKTIEWHRVKLPPEARRAYVALEDDFAEFAKGGGELSSAKAAGKLERLKQAALAGKMPEAVAFLRGVLAKGEKLVVFSRYRDAIASLARELADARPVLLTGDSSPEERAEAERRFQEDPACRVFIGQLVAAGTALTLTAGTHAVFLDLDWNPANHRQAMDRIHRRGQTKPVTAHFFLAEETVDEDVARVLDAKGRMMDALLQGTGGALAGAKRLVGERILARRAATASA